MNDRCGPVLFAVRVFILQSVIIWGRVAGRHSCCAQTSPTPTMRSWECGVCVENVDNSGPSPVTSASCRRVFKYTMNIEKCEMAEDKCSDKNRLLECPPDNYDSCLNLYKTEFQCKCIPNYIGNYCKTLKPKDYVERPEGWVMFLQHTIRYESRRNLDIVVLASEDTGAFSRNGAVTTVQVCNSQGANVLFTKYTTKITGNDNIIVWCQVTTTLGDYCNRLTLIMESNPQQKNRVKNLFIISAYFPAVQKFDPLLDGSHLFVSTGEESGYLSIIRTRVFTDLLKTPYLTRDPSKNLMLYDREGETFFNYTDVDMRCFPEIYINPESIIARKATRSFTNQDIYIRATFMTPRANLNCFKAYYREWKLWKLKYNVNMDEGVEVSKSGTTELLFRAYTFRQSGAYYVSFNAENFMTVGAKFYNFKGAWIEIIHHPLFVHVPYFERYVNYEDENKIIVDAKDENVEPSEARKALKFYWSCKSNFSSGCHGVERYFKEYSPEVVFPKYSLKVHSLYTINITVQKPSVPLLSPVSRIVILTVGTKEPDTITLQCSCEDYIMLPEELNFIFVKASDGISLPRRIENYIWEYATVTKEDLDNNKIQLKSADDLRIYGTSIYTFKIKENVLEYAKSYVFKATVSNRKNVYSTLLVNTPHAAYELVCSSTPQDGVRGLTNFGFNCSIPREAGSLYYEFYDKAVDDSFLFSGRMLGYSNDGLLHNCKLTEGIVHVFAYDYFRVIASFALDKIKLAPYNGTCNELDGYLDFAQHLVAENQYDYASRLVSVVPTVIEKTMNPRPQTLERAVLILNQIPDIDYLPTVKVVLSSLRTVLQATTSKSDVFKLNAALPKSASDVLLMVTRQIMRVENKMKTEKLTYRLYIELMKAILDCAELILMQKNQEALSKPEAYVRPFINDVLHTTTYAVVHVLEMVGYSLSHTQGPGDSQTELVAAMGNVSALVMVTWSRELRKWSIDNSTSVDITQTFANSVGKPTDEVVVMCIRSNVNPYWWADDQVVSEVLIFNMCKRKNLLKCLALTKFSQRLSLHLEITKPLDFLVPIIGVAYYLDHTKMDEEELDLGLTVYRFFLPKKAKLFLEFLFVESEEFKVMFVEGMRPDYEMMKDATIINAKSPKYLLQYDNKEEGEEKMLYMAILPGADISPKEFSTFKLKAYYVQCLTWLKWYYSPFGCWVGSNTNESSVQCDCDHLSIISSTIAVPENDLQPFFDFPLFLTPTENYAPFFLLLCMILLYLLMMSWALLRDKKDREKQDVVILDDNFPGESFAYLVGVYTGSKINAGTTALIGIRLYGMRENSRAHILTSTKRKVLKAFSDDWFLIYSPKHLDKIRRLLVWHNSKGYSPDWFVQKIEVYDLHSELQYIFEINDWISIDWNRSPEVYISPIKLYLLFNTSKVFCQNFSTGLKDTHHWTSIFLKHPRNPVTRGARINVNASFTLFVFALCLVLYIQYLGPDEEDVPEYKLSYADFFIFFLVYIPASRVACLAMGMFRKTYTHEHEAYVAPHVFKQIMGGDENVSNYVEEDQLYAFREPDLKRFRSVEVVHIRPNTYRYRLQGTQQNAQNIREYIVMAIHKMARGSLLLPVKLPGHESKLKINRRLRIVAWVFCGAIDCLSIITILYFAWRLPAVETEKYIFTSLGIILFDALFISFLKIIIFSAILSLMFQNILPTTSYNINPKDGARHSLFGDKTFLSHLLQVREKHIYSPLQYKEVDFEGFTHLTVNHTYNFVDPDTGAHTQHIERLFRLWREVRGNVPRFGNTKHHFIGHIAEFMFKRKHNDYKQRLYHLFRAIGEVYNGEPSQQNTDPVAADSDEDVEPAIAEKKRVRKIRHHKLRLLVDFVMVVVLILVISIITSFYITERFPTNDHVSRMMLGRSEQKSPSFQEVHNRTEYCIPFLADHIS